MSAKLTTIEITNKILQFLRQEYFNNNELGIEPFENIMQHSTCNKPKPHRTGIEIQVGKVDFLGNAKWI